jgi:hypothetical protein
MNEAQYALAGAAVGSVIPGLVTWWSAWREDRRAVADRQDARDARLFDHRREAYAEYLRTARSLLEAAWEYHVGLLGNVAPPDYDFTDPLGDRMGDVELYGTRETAAGARRAQRHILSYANGAADDHAAYDEASLAVTNFAELARRDLGVGESGPLSATDNGDAPPLI